MYVPRSLRAQLQWAGMGINICSSTPKSLMLVNNKTKPIKNTIQDASELNLIRTRSRITSGRRAHRQREFAGAGGWASARAGAGAWAGARARAGAAARLGRRRPAAIPRWWTLYTLPANPHYASARRNSTVVDPLPINYLLRGGGGFIASSAVAEASWLLTPRRAVPAGVDPRVLVGSGTSVCAAWRRACKNTCYA